MAQRHYHKHQMRTKVLPASLTNAADAMLLLGADHMTIAPRILEDLDKTQADSSSNATQPIFELPESIEEDWPSGQYLSVEDQFGLAMTMEQDGTGEAKLVQVCGFIIPC